MRELSKASKRQLLSLAVLAASGAIGSRAMGQTNILLNGGFETTDPVLGSGYAQYWTPNSPNITQSNANPHTGSFSEYLDNTVVTSNDTVYQDTLTGTVTPGSVYTLDFFAAGNFAAGGNAQVQVVWFTAGSGPSGYSGIQTYFPGSSYGENKYTFTAPVNTSFAEVQFSAVTGGATGSVAQEYLDDVSLSAPAAVAGISAWNSTGPGDWNLSSNWNNGVPNGVDSEADLFGALTANHTVYTDSAVTLGTLNFNNTNTYVVTGAGSLTMQASTGAATVIVQSGTQKINLPLTIASNTNLNVSSGAALLISNPVTINPGLTLASIGSGPVTYQSTVTVGAGSIFSMSSSTSGNALTLLANASATLAASAPTSRKLLQLTNVSLSTGSSLDLSNNDLIVHGGVLSAVSGQVGAGYSNGTWTGNGIKSSAAAADQSHLTALGVIANTNSQGGALYGNGTALGLFDGTSPAAGDVLVKYTYYGDTNLDGKVDGSDYANIDNGYLSKLTGWANGDLNYDGVVNGSDYTLMDNAFNSQGLPIASASSELASATAQLAGTSATSSVPEPATLSLLSIAAAGLLRRRRRVEN